MPGAGRFLSLLQLFIERDRQIAHSLPRRARPCHRGIGEFSVYVRRDYRGRGAGRAVLASTK
jgi:L-amino acid N-acyltransferase YncA